MIPPPVTISSARDTGLRGFGGGDSGRRRGGGGTSSVVRPAATVAIHPGGGALSAAEGGRETNPTLTHTRNSRGGERKRLGRRRRRRSLLSALSTGSSAAAAEEETSSPERGGVSPFLPSSFLSLSLSFRGPSSATHSPVWKGRRGGGGGGGGTHSGSPRKSVSFLHLALGLFWRRRRRPRSEGGQGGFWAVSSAFPQTYSFFLHSYA